MRRGAASLCQFRMQPNLHAAPKRVRNRAVLHRRPRQLLEGRAVDAPTVPRTDSSTVVIFKPLSIRSSETSALTSSRSGGVSLRESAAANAIE